MCDFSYFLVCVRINWILKVTILRSYATFYFVFPAFGGEVEFLVQNLLFTKYDFRSTIWELACHIEWTNGVGLYRDVLCSPKHGLQIRENEKRTTNNG